MFLKSPIFNVFFALGTKSGFQMSAGYPNVRFSVARKFADLNGFSLIVTSLRGRDSPWIGCEVLYNIVQMAQSYEVRNLKFFNHIRV